MNQNLSPEARKNTNPTNRNPRQTQMRADADAMLRDIAFVLKMTQRVREDIEAAREADEPALA